HVRKRNRAVLFRGVRIQLQLELLHPVRHRAGCESRQHRAVVVFGTRHGDDWRCAGARSDRRDDSRLGLPQRDGRDDADRRNVDHRLHSDREQTVARTRYAGVGRRLGPRKKFKFWPAADLPRSATRRHSMPSQTTENNEETIVLSRSTLSAILAAFTAVSVSGSQYPML